MNDMSGYELNDQHIETVLKNLRALQPDATREDAINLLLETKMKIREMTPKEQLEELNKLKNQESN